MASQGIPKYALTPWLILWFGIGDAPKVIVVTLFVFYITFITVFAGVRGVDQRLSTWRASLARASAPSRER
jgi:ABC-type nitrate/sulfonate/bicarbonate transport system, permease component